MHFAWTQATWPDEDTLPIELSSMRRTPPGLSGNLRLYLSRYLHLVIDLQLDAPGETIGRDGRTDNAQRFEDHRIRNDPGLMDEPYDLGVPARVRYRLEENRILRSGELRYFDHPKFGVLAKVWRVEEEPEEALDTTNSELLGYPAE